MLHPHALGSHEMIVVAFLIHVFDFSPKWPEITATFAAQISKFPCAELIFFRWFPSSERPQRIHVHRIRRL